MLKRGGRGVNTNNEKKGRGWGDWGNRVSVIRDNVGRTSNFGKGNGGKNRKRAKRALAQGKIEAVRKKKGKPVEGEIKKGKGGEPGDYST